MRIAAVILCALLAACQSKGQIKPDLPTDPVVTSKVVYVDRFIYVGVPVNLTKEEPVAEGSLSQCPDVGRSRKAAIQRGNAKLREIRAIQGTAVKP